MVDLNLGGACPRRPLTYVIPRLMMNPSGPVDASIKGVDLAVGASNGDLEEGITVMADVAIRTRASCLLANFADDVTTVCCGLYMFKPMGNEVLIGRVEPCILRKGSPMILVATDRSRAFRLDAAGRLISCPVPRHSRFVAGVERGWSEIRRRMADAIDGTEFRYPSYAVEVAVLHVPVFAPAGLP